jgi:hypothetical protein
MNALTVAYAVMSIPARARLASGLLKQLPTDTVHTIDRRRSGAWENAREAWLQLADSETQWSVVVQDDVELCSGFTQLVSAQLQQHPLPTSFFWGSTAKYRSLVDETKDHTIILHGSDILPTGVCLALPTKHLREMVQFCDQLPTRKFGTHDDTRIVEWLRSRKWPLAYPIPSLADHHGEHGSTFTGHVGRRRALRFRGSRVSGPHDVVYPLGPTPHKHPELRYSLRSLSLMPHRNVHIFGEHPGWTSAEVRVVRVPPSMKSVDVRLPAPESMKWGNIVANLLVACADNQVSDNFVLMNDDFFLTRPTEAPAPQHRESLREQAVQLPTENPYRKMLELTADWLEQRGHPSVSYELHQPMLVNRRLLLEVLKSMPHSRLLYRSLYGNLLLPPGVAETDCKVRADDAELPDLTGRWCLSTDDRSFRRVLPTLKQLFPRTSSYEN